jgi:hypothetical protein
MITSFRFADDSGVNDDNGPPRSRSGRSGYDGRRTRGNELVVWIDDEKRRDLFAELQMCHDPGSYANSAGVASDPENRSTQDLSGFWFRP